MIWYVLRHKLTGAWMGSLEGKQRAGYTHEEFTEARPPRLFTTQRGAANALSLWLRGRHKVKYTTVGHFDEPSTDIDVTTEPVPSRGVRDDYEVLPVVVKPWRDK